MATTIYMMPITGTGTLKDPRVPKYRSEFGGASWTMMDYGMEPVCLVAVEDIAPADNTVVVSNLDVTAFPSDLSQTVGAQINVIKNVFGGFNIPNGWVQNAFTYLQSLRVVVLLFQFMQRYNESLPNTPIFTGGVTLGTTFGALSANVRVALQAAAASLGFDTSGIVSGTTIGAALKILADQYSSIQVNLGGQVF